MSNKALTWALNLPLKGPKKSVLLALANALNEGTNKCFPGVDVLALHAGCDRRSVTRALNMLEKGGYIQVKRSIGAHHNYTLNMGHSVTSDRESPLTESPITPDRESHDMGQSVPLNRKKQKEPESKGRFTPPSLEEIQSHCQLKNYSWDAEHFFAYHNSAGWVVGRKKMKCWKSAMITWNKNHEKFENSNRGSSKQSRSDEIREATFDTNF